MQLHIVRKTYRGEVVLFSNSSRTSIVKEPWGCIKNCKFPVKTDKFGMTNSQGRSIAFNKSQLDPSLWKICPFTRSLIVMRAEGQEEKLSRFVSLMLRCKQFVTNPIDENYDKDGVDIKQKIVGEEEMVDFCQFLSEALEASMPVEELSDIPGKCNGGKKRSRKEVHDSEDDEDVVNKKRLTRAEEIEKAKLDELKNKKGMEAQVKQSISTRREVSLDNLVYSKKLEKESPINEARVNSLYKSVKENFDLSQMTLTVCLHPDSEDSGVLDKDSKFVVICGRYRLLVLQKLDAQSLLKKIPGFEDREVMCIVLDSISPSIQSYIYHRSNKIQADVLGFSCNSLVFTVLGLRETIRDTAEVAEIICLCIA